jgi:carbonic anhydrase
MASGEGLSKVAMYGAINGKPTLMIDKWFKSVRADGDFGKITINNKVYHAKHLQLVTSSLHKINDENFVGEMLIVHELEGSMTETPWSPVHDSVDTVVVSVMFSQSASTTTFPQGSYSPLWEAMGFPRDSTVLRRNWLDNAQTQGFQGWRTSTLTSLIGAPLSGSFFGYHGSLPVPPCSENVIYYVLEQSLPVSAYQVEGLLAVLEGESVEHNQRPAQRQIGDDSHNLMQVSGSVTDSCSYLEAASTSAVCWQCNHDDVKSPINIETAKATSPSMTPTPGFDGPNLKYHPTTAYSERGVMSLVIRPADYHNFGRLELGGRFYTAEMITVHAVGVHAFDGVRYDGEIHIHHYMYGDWFPAEHSGHQGTRRLDAFRGDTHMDINVEGAPPFQVVIAIPLKVTTNPGGDFMHDLLPHGLQSGEKAYASHDDLKMIFDGDFYQYRGTLIHPACDTTTTHWIMYSTPLKVSAEQLYTEYPTRSGFDTTPALVHHDNVAIMKNHVPLSVMSSGADCASFGPHDWTYADAECWSVQYPNCAGVKQSPINIDTTTLVTEDAHHKDNFLNFAKYHPVANLKVVHKGHTLQVANKQNGISHLGLGYIEVQGYFYFLRQIHIHFPSEHAVDGVKHAAEMHLVHQRQDHWGASAFNNSDILVAAVFFDIGPTESPLLKQFGLPKVDHEHDVQIGWEETLEEPLDLLRGLGPVLKGDYFRYEGSFTTPPCDEVVKWFVFKTSLSASQEQFASFKHVFPNPANSRPVRPLNGRQVGLNSFDAPGEVYTPMNWEFWLDRKHGRNRDEPSPFIITGGVIGGIVLAVLIMSATFIRQNPASVASSAGGLVNSESVGRSRYGRMSDRA